MFRVNCGDLLSAVSYALRREVAIHSIVSGSAYSALFRFIHLLESVSASHSSGTNYIYMYLYCLIIVQLASHHSQK